MILRSTTGRLRLAALGLIIFLTTLGFPGRVRAWMPVATRPINVAIPSIGVQANIENLSVNAKGVMNAPISAWTVGWYQDGARPGQAGNAVMYGHLNTAKSKTAIFTRLKDVQTGDLINITDKTGNLWRYRVTEVATYPVKNVPMSKLMGATPDRHLNLYTCAGTWSRWGHNYSHRLVVYSSLVTVSTPTLARK